MVNSLLFVPLINGYTTCVFRSPFCTYTQDRRDHKCHPSWRESSSLSVRRNTLLLHLTRYFLLFHLTRYFPLFVWRYIPPVLLKTAQLLQNFITLTPNSMSNSMSTAVIGVSVLNTVLLSLFRNRLLPKNGHGTNKREAEIYFHLKKFQN
jgi:hypothetical protein